ncbi:MAG: tRNA-dihydrouridine synthase family protein [Lachnospiraceae bacterium]|nr:tRNA-dihydrouridine synthase family protein [Lachnospiraceae bacterium]
MKYYLAPLEGITGHVFRNVIKDMFGKGVVKYYTPFIHPRPKKGMQDKERAGLLPENNPGISLVPQILCNDPAAFVSLAEEISSLYGWEEINLNAGCPSPTVTAHDKGAGMLRDPEALDRFLDYIFSHSDLKISVKTRIGVSAPSEFAAILSVYEKYPICELTIHPRVLKEQYRPGVHADVFYAACRDSRLPLVYNGDIFSEEDLERIVKPAGERVGAVMLGRGMLRDPSLARRLSGGAAADGAELSEFLDRLFADYRALYGGDENTVLYRMKELWSYLGQNFPEKDAALKKLRKAKNRPEYEAAKRDILS